MGSSSRNLVAVVNRGSGRLGLIDCSPTALLDFVTDQLVGSVVWWEDRYIPGIDHPQVHVGVGVFG